MANPHNRKNRRGDPLMPAFGASARGGKAPPILKYKPALEASGWFNDQSLFFIVS